MNNLNYKKNNNIQNTNNDIFYMNTLYYKKNNNISTQIIIFFILILRIVEYFK